MKIKSLIGLMVSLVICTTACSSNQQPVQNVVAVKQDSAMQIFGVVKYNNIENISIDFQAAVQKLYTKEGDMVKKGANLIALDITDYEKEIKSKEHELALEQINLSKQKIEIGDIQNQLNQQIKDITTKTQKIDNNSDSDIVQIQNDLKYAQDVYAKALEELSSKEKLYNAGAIPKDDVNQFKKTVDEKKKNVDDLNQKLESKRSDQSQELDKLILEKTKLVARAEKAQADMQLIDEKLRKLESDINDMKQKLDKTFLKSGVIVCDMEKAVVSDINYAAGDYVVPKQKIITLINADSIFIEADVPEEFIKYIKPGTEVTYNLQIDKSKQFKGKVVRVSNIGVEKNAETVIPIEIQPEPNKDLVLIPNINVDITLDVQK